MRSKDEIASLSRDRSIVELIMMKTVKQTNVVRGILHLFQARGIDDDDYNDNDSNGNNDLEAQAKSEEVRKLIRWGVKIARETLSAGEEVSKLL